MGRLSRGSQKSNWNNCLWCKEKYRAHTVVSKFCSAQCRALSHQQNKPERIFRETVLDTRGRFCQSCPRNKKYEDDFLFVRWEVGEVKAIENAFILCGYHHSLMSREKANMNKNARINELNQRNNCLYNKTNIAPLSVPPSIGVHYGNSINAA